MNKENIKTIVITLLSVILVSHSVEKKNIIDDLNDRVGFLNLKVSVADSLVKSTTVNGLILADKLMTYQNRLKDLEANTDKLQENIQRNSILVTALVPQLGYDKAAEIAKEAMSSNKTIKEVLLDSNLFSSDEIDNLLDIEKLI